VRSSRARLRPELGRRGNRRRRSAAPFGASRGSGCSGEVEARLWLRAVGVSFSGDKEMCGVSWAAVEGHLGRGSAVASSGTRKGRRDSLNRREGRLPSWLRLEQRGGPDRYRRHAQRAARTASVQREWRRGTGRVLASRRLGACTASGRRPREGAGPDADGLSSDAWPCAQTCALRAETCALERGLAQIDLVNARLTTLYSKNLNWMKFSPKIDVVA
jgi:hypothetical protein